MRVSESRLGVRVDTWYTESSSKTLRPSLIHASGRPAGPRVRSHRSVVAGLAVTPTGQRPAGGAASADRRRRAVVAAQRATTRRHAGSSPIIPGFPLRAPSDLDAILDALGVEGRALEAAAAARARPTISSRSSSRAARSRRSAPRFRSSAQLVEAVASFKSEIADVRRKIEPSGEVADNASPALAQIRERLRRQKQRLRTTLDSFLRGRETRSTCRSRSSPIATAATC